jgi:hypothetical protein
VVAMDEGVFKEAVEAIEHPKSILES